MKHVSVTDMDGDGACPPVEASVLEASWCSRHRARRTVGARPDRHALFAGDKDVVVSHLHGVDYYSRTGTSFTTYQPVVGQRFMDSVGSHPAGTCGAAITRCPFFLLG